MRRPWLINWLCSVKCPGKCAPPVTHEPTAADIVTKGKKLKSPRHKKKNK